MTTAELRAIVARECYSAEGPRRILAAVASLFTDEEHDAIHNAWQRSLIADAMDGRVDPETERLHSAMLAIRALRGYARKEGAS